MSKAVIPLESNPEIFTQFAHFLGLEPQFSFFDVYSLFDQGLLSFIPRPSPAVILLFPITEEYEKFRITEEQEQQEQNKRETDDVVWFKQTIKNACGLYALLNAISNLTNDKYEPGSKILEFKQNHADVKKIEALIDAFQEDYSSLATSGQTEAPDAQEDVNLHFIAIIKKDGKIFELDGRRNGVVALGDADDKEAEDLLSERKLAERFQKYVDLADENNKLNFSVIALAPSFD
jgi:ubiquitin carboxyl-terminal hydrolase L3